MVRRMRNSTEIASCSSLDGPVSAASDLRNSGATDSRATPPEAVAGAFALFLPRKISRSLLNGECVHGQHFPFRPSFDI